MALTESIIIVSHPKMAKFGRVLVHGITVHEKIKASLYTLQQYRDNEHQISGRQPVIFFGKNKISESYIEGMHVEYSKYGIKWGWNGPKAIVYIEYTPDEKGRLDFKEEFFRFKKDIEKQKKTQKERKKQEEKVKWYELAIGTFLTFPILVVLMSWFLGKELVERNELSHMQMQYAMSLFLRDGLSKYIKQLSE